MHLRDASLVLTGPPPPYNRVRRPGYAVAMRVAAIDCGTNSLRLLVADVDPATGSLHDVTREMVVVRLGEGVDRTGVFAPEALERTFAVVDAYAETCRALGAEAIRFVATSASRDVLNREEFASGIESRIGVSPDVISGHEEASLSFLGATANVAERRAGPFLVVDLGGGSTELALGTTEVTAAYSMNVGCVRMTERRLRSDPPTDVEVAIAADEILAALGRASAEVPLGQTRTLIGLSGTITTVTAHALALDAYRPELIDGSVLPLEAVRASCAALLNATREERAAMPFMHPGRVDVIGGGALVWSVVVDWVAREVEAAGGSLETVVTSEHDILDGIALALVPA